LITAPIVSLTRPPCPGDAFHFPWFPYPLMVLAVGGNLSGFRVCQLFAVRVSQMALHLVIKGIA
jgi:hypothetical protein